ncbi:MAG: dipeptide ABC transporter ATP-binding protein [Pseudomonadota bacterium]
MLLQVNNLSACFRTGGETVTAVDDVSFHLNKGETFCLVGESGSGKSVSALSIMRLLPQETAFHPQGEILFGETNLLTLPDEQMRDIRGGRISMIFQEPMTSLNPVFTIGDQLIEALQLHRPTLTWEAAEKQAIEALEQVQIPEATQRMGEYPHRLSGGQRQRVMIAMAMICEPDLLIADEPTTALDVTVQAEILRLMNELQARRGTSILFITHDFGVVSHMADRLAVMRQGKIVETGGLDETLHRPQHDYTKALLNALPENLQRTQELLVEDAEPIIELQDVQVHFPIKRGVLRRTVDHVHAVDGVTLNIDKGRILALVGESGCGKTTLGRAIIRLLNTTSGSIKFEGQDITQLSRRQMQPLRSKMQIIFQDPMASLNPRLHVATTLTEPMAAHGVGNSQDERLELAAQMLESVQLERSHLWRYPHEFSGGQRQRISIARALVLNPSFIVCDEVTSALDVSVQAEILQILLDLRRERGLTLLFITHNIGVVEYVSDETAVMYAGQIVEHGLTAKVCGSPEHEYTQKLLAAAPRVN